MVRLCWWVQGFRIKQIERYHHYPLQSCQLLLVPPSGLSSLGMIPRSQGRPLHPPSHPTALSEVRDPHEHPILSALFRACPLFAALLFPTERGWRLCRIRDMPLTHFSGEHR